MFDLVTEIMVTHANNDWISRRRTLVDQVGTSYAANAYNSLARASHAFELIRLAALWDDGQPDRTSLLAIYNLIKPADVRTELKRRWLLSWEGQSAEYIADMAERFDSMLAEADRLIPAVEKSKRLKKLRNHRNNHIAHNLAPAPGAENPRYGEETRLLRTTWWMANLLNGMINSVSTAYSMSKEIADSYAEALWADTQLRIRR
ncbi:hypothetical protein [Caulobacter sp. UC70_42]|uniref:AbiU2 domain-containing protein n=1 Tax=Caulobacter sp. UC70_42 TaxID=3374551 RepID=UPI0037583DC4